MAIIPSKENVENRPISKATRQYDETITINREELKDVLSETMRDVLSELGVKVDPGLIYRPQMIAAIGRGRFDEAVKKGHLNVRKQNPLKRNSAIYCKKEDWDRFVKDHVKSDL